MDRRSFILSGALACVLAGALAIVPALAAPTDVPAPGTSKTVDAIKKNGVLRAAAIGEFPWLPENTTGSGPQFSGPA